MSEAVIDDIVVLLPPLLQSLEALGFVARHFHPPSFDRVMEAAGAPDAELSVARPQLSSWPAEFADVQRALETASDAALSAFSGLRAVQAGGGDITLAFRALRQLPRAEEALYPLAAKFPPLSSFFLNPGLCNDAELLARLAVTATETTGVIHDHNEPRSRGGFSLYVPEYYTPDRAWPLVMALHGGSGNGRGFLWRWLRDARSLGAILVAPTALGATWALMGEDADTANLSRILDSVRSRWNIDPTKLLLTGMSDGGTFSYVTGLESASPFTHLAPVAATFHPLMAQLADADRLRGLPIHMVHGALDWMFPVETARQTRDALVAAGADVTYREVDNLSHCYPREMNAPILAWLGVP
ncbi:phospholipase [Bradyrhizobium sp.]|uniref:carboxylesterase family protein n=1 Tax=Bradyrhizobium sp. TaxID=376 RepID=UPI00263160FE|nr:phospholipase [Bradyrhizobium sp.]